MPQSKAREAARGKSNRRMLDIIAQAQKLDRRRQAQIENQERSIARLLARLDAAATQTQTGNAITTPTAYAAYTEEMRILHEAAAAILAENGELRDAMRDLVSAIDALPDNRAGGDRAASDGLAVALAAARALVAVSAPVSESGGEAG